jgi:hypothetical protein
MPAHVTMGTAKMGAETMDPTFRLSASACHDGQVSDACFASAFVTRPGSRKTTNLLQPHITPLRLTAWWSSQFRLGSEGGTRATDTHQQR